jgi:hypothetical protein
VILRAPCANLSSKTDTLPVRQRQKIQEALSEFSAGVQLTVVAHVHSEACLANQ